MRWVCVVRRMSSVGVGGGLEKTREAHPSTVQLGADHR